MRTRVVIATSTLAALLASAPLFAAKLTVDVVGVPKPAAAPALTPDQAASAKRVYDTRCGLCHGPTGAGDGPAAISLVPKPRRFSDRFWQASVDDAGLTAVILQGGTARKLSPLMPAAPELKGSPDLAALIAFIRSVSAPNGTVLVRAEAGATKLSTTADATADGKARAVLDVKPGKYNVVVESAPGVSLCVAAATVADTDVSVSCAPAAAKP